MTEQKNKNFKVGTLLSMKDIGSIDTIVKKGEYLNRSDFIRDAVREKLKRENQVIIKNNKVLDEAIKIVNERKLKEKTKKNKSKMYPYL